MIGRRFASNLKYCLPKLHKCFRAKHFELYVLCFPADMRDGTDEQVRMVE